MAAKPRNRASLDADAVARMMREQDEPSDAAAAEPAPEPPEPPVSPPIAPAAEPDPRPLASRSGQGIDFARVDGRALRRTGREPFATRIKPEAHEAMRRIAYNRGVTIAEVLEAAVAAYDRAQKS